MQTTMIQPEYILFKVADWVVGGNLGILVQECYFGDGTEVRIWYAWKWNTNINKFANCGA